MRAAFVKLVGFAALAAAIPLEGARAACNAANQFTLRWTNYASVGLAYGPTYSHTVTNAAGASRTVQYSFTQNGLASTSAAGEVYPRRGVYDYGTKPATDRVLAMAGTFTGRTANISNAARVAFVTFTFSEPVRDVSFSIFDIDYAGNQYRDWIKVTGQNGATTYDATLTKPAASQVKIGPSATTPTVGASEAIGIGASAVNQDIGTVVATFAAPVTSVTVRYGNSGQSAGGTSTGQQRISIHDISFCPLPAFSVSKSVAPFVPVGEERFRTPGTDQVYTVTMENTGGSDADADTIELIDLLPPTVTFHNGDFDGSTSGPIKFTANASGLTYAPAADVSFGTGAGPTWGYNPGAGYDPAVSALRFSPKGGFAADSSATFQFRVRIK